jgi:hypothetical protein
MTRRLHLPGLFAVLLALMAQLGLGGIVPRVDAFRAIGAAGVLCHANGQAGDHVPGHPADCPVCPLCAALHASPALLPAGTIAVPLPSLVVRSLIAWLPPRTGPPPHDRTPRQPRAPPSDI